MSGAFSPRYTCSGAAELRKENIDTARLGKHEHLALGGCYIEMMNAVPAWRPARSGAHPGGNKVRPRKALYGQCIPVSAMGIEFTAMDEQDRTRLTLLVNWMAGGAVGNPMQLPSPPPPPVIIHSRIPRAGNRIRCHHHAELGAELGRSKNALSRQDFIELLEKPA